MDGFQPLNHNKQKWENCFPTTTKKNILKRKKLKFNDKYDDDDSFSIHNLVKPNNNHAMFSMAPTPRFVDQKVNPRNRWRKTSAKSLLHLSHAPCAWSNQNSDSQARANESGAPQKVQSDTVTREGIAHLRFPKRDTSRSKLPERACVKIGDPEKRRTKTHVKYVDSFFCL